MQCCSLCYGAIDNDVIETGQREECVRQFCPPAESRAVAQIKCEQEQLSILDLRRLNM